MTHKDPEESMLHYLLNKYWVKRNQEIWKFPLYSCLREIQTRNNTFSIFGKKKKKKPFKLVRMLFNGKHSQPGWRKRHWIGLERYFQMLCEKFLKHYANFYCPPKTIDSIFGLKQRPSETIKSFLHTFNQALL